MKRKIKEAWVAALRSGEYKQGKKRLRTKNNHFCCLGVLCNLHAQAHPKTASSQDTPLLYGGEEGLPPDFVFNWAGFNKYKKVTINGKTMTLDEHNDRGCSFEAIAKAIEEQL